MISYNKSLITLDIEEAMMSSLIAIQTTICITLALLPVLAFCSYTLFANAMRATQSHSVANLNPSHNVLQRPPGFPSVLKIGSTVFDRVVELWKISNTNTSKLSSNYLGIGCNIYSHLGFRPLPQSGNLPPRMVFVVQPGGYGACIRVGYPFHTIALRCDPNQCETNSIFIHRKITAKADDIWNSSQSVGSISWKFDVLGRIKSDPDMVKINFSYSDSSNKIEFNIVNATLTYGRQVYFCNLDQECIPGSLAMRSFNNP